MTRRPWPLTLLMLVLLAWEPLAFALYASGVVDRVLDRGALAMAVLVLRAAVTAIGIGAGLAIRNDRPWAASFALRAIWLSAAVTVLGAITRALPDNTPPGLAGPLLGGRLAWDAAWITYLALLERRGSARNPL